MESEAAVSVCVTEHVPASLVTVKIESLSPDSSPTHSGVEEGTATGAGSECSLCGDEFRSTMALKIHTTKVHSAGRRSTQVMVRTHAGGVKSLACPTCRRSFSTRKRLREHEWSAHPPAAAAVPCPHPSCHDKLFRSPSSLKVHMKMVHARLAVPCQHCHKTFKSPLLLQKHMEWSHPVDRARWPCPLCPALLVSQPSYTKHIEYVHPPASALVSCQQDGCRKLFKSALHLKQHHRRYHLGERAPRRPRPASSAPAPAAPHACPHCSRSFTAAATRDRHAQLEHPHGPESNTCRLCQRALPDKASLKRHMLGVHATELGAGPYSCHVCYKNYKSTVSLQQHLRVTHAPPSAAVCCQLCGKTLKCRAHLQVHMSTVHCVSEGGGALSCGECGKVFSRRRYLERHERLHTDKSLPCGECSKMFKTSEDVSRHRKRVHAPRPDTLPPRWQCGECDKELSTVYTLRAHLATHGGGAECHVTGCRLGYAHGTLRAHEQAHAHDTLRAEQAHAHTVKTEPDDTELR